MKLPYLCGDSVITVQLTEEDKVEDDVVFYLVFTGSTVQHCTSTRKINPGSLETISPGHDCCETVKVALCASREGHPVLVVAEESFQFVQDEAYDAAQFLATCAGNQQALNFTRFLDRSRPPAADVDFLDEKVALAFRHLKLPAEWNVLGADQSLTENIPRETLMHFAVRLGLLRLTWFLLQQPGGRGALSIHNNEGATPVSLALERGYQKLHQLLTEEEAREPDSWSTLSHTVHSGDYSVKHHRGLDVYMLTAEAKEGEAANWESDIRHLQMHMQSHQHMVRNRPDGHPTATSQSLEEMAREGRQESPSAPVHLDMGQLSDQTHQEEKCNSRSLGAFNDVPNDSLSLGDAQNPECFCERKNVTLRKKEEEGPTSAEGSGTVSDEKDCTGSLSARVNGVVNLPSCGNTNEEAGMTSAGVVLDQAGLCDSPHQEAQGAEEHSADSTVSVVETAGEAPASLEGVDVAMGQTECRNCAGAAERAAGQQQVEDGTAEAGERRTANLEQQLPSKEESPSSAQPLLSAFNGTERADGEDEDVGVVPACDSTHANSGTGELSADLCKTSDNKETGADSCTDQLHSGFLESQGDAHVSARQDVITSTRAAVNGVKVPVCASKPAPGLEIDGGGKSGEQEEQVEAGCMNRKSSLPSLEDSVETDGPYAKPENDDVGGSNESSAEPVCGQDSGKSTEHVAEAMEGSEAHEEEPVGTDTSSSGDGGSADSSGGGQEVASGCPCADQTVVKGEMGDGFKPDAAQESKQEPASLPPEDASTCLSEKEPAQTETQIAESALEQEGLNGEMESPRGEGPTVSQEGDAAVAPLGQEAALQGSDPGLAPCAKGADCTEDNSVGTPSAIHIGEPKQNQEAVAAAAGSAELAWQCSGEHGSVAAVAGWPGDHAGDEGSSEQSFSQQAEGGKAEPEQEGRASGREQVLSEEFAAVVKPSVCSQEGPVASRSDVDAGLKGTVCAEEVCKAEAEGAGEGIIKIADTVWGGEHYKAVFAVVLTSLNLLRVCELYVQMLQKASARNSFCFAPIECENFLEDGLSSVCASSQGGLKRESGSESDLFPLPGDGMEDLVFGKPEEEQSACDVTSSSSSADDTMSLERNSSLGSDTSLPFPPIGNFVQPKDRHSLDGSCINMVATEGGEKEEELDSITDVPTHSSVLRNSMRPLSPFRRHSWGPGKNATNEGCKESVASCAKVKMKPQRGMLQAHDTSSLPTVTMRNKSSQPKERPRSAILAPDENTVTSIFNNRRSQQPTALSKSVSIQNIAGVGNDDSLIHTWKFLSQSTDSLHKISRVNESVESLVDEGKTDMNEGQLMGDLELDSKQLEAESWSQVVDSKFLQQQNKDVVKRQDVIYELMQTEMHHVRTLKIMNDVYSAGMLKELQYDQQVVDKIFPCLENLLHIHSHFFQRILERKKESLADKSEKNFVIKRIGDILVNQFSGESAERMKKTYGKFCGHHNEAVNNFKDLYSKDKRFQAFIKKKMNSSLMRRLGISECILLVTQRITKYPVLLQRILQYTKENEVEHEDLTQSLNLVKDVIAAVNSKVSNYEKKMRLGEIYNRTDSKSIMRMKSGQMFAREDLRHRKLIRDGPVSLKNAAGRLKEVQAVLLSDMLVFLQEKDQKYVFASLDQKSTVISLKKLIVREVAHEEKGLFLISMGVKDPEMVEVHASSKEERNGWIQIIQDTMNTMDKDEDEGVPCESDFEKKVSDAKVRGLKEQLQQKDKQILLLLEEKAKIFRDMADSSVQEDMPGSRLLFRANTEEAPKGEAIMKTALNEVELLQDLVNRSLGTALGQQVSSTAMEQEGGVGPISLPRRAETFGGFDSHQMNASKCGAKDEGEDAQDLRRTESDSILKKVSLGLSGVVLQQDTYIEDQKLALSERALTRSFFRPTSLLEQEKQRNLEKQRQELANLKKQQTQHQEERRKREKEWEVREKELAEQEAHLAQREEQVQRGWQDLEREREELQVKKASYQLDLERLRTAQKQLEREKVQFKQDVERLAQMRQEPDHNQVSNLHEKLARVSSQSSIDESSKQKSPSLPKQGHFDAELSVSPKRNSLSRTHKEKSTFHLLSTTNQTNKAAEEQPQMPTRLFSLAKPKDKKEKKKKGRGHRSQQSDSHSSEAPPEGEEIFC
uniref:A-kinase anchoring protein 13 n=1 Tax=Strigops habroptila TaxID=2489341 RepID=A0A672V7E9_STRHB